MTRQLPPVSAPARMETVAYYYREGRRMLKSALAASPGLDPIEALVKQQEDGGPLESSSILVYRGILRRIAAMLLRFEGRSEAFPELWPRLDAALTARKDKATKEGKERVRKKNKVEDATEAEAAALFTELKRHGLKSGNMNAVMAALFTLVAGHSGFRPVELMGAELAGTTLILPNAKRRQGQAPSRVQELGGLDKDVRIGLDLLISLIDHDLSRRQFRAWEKCLAEQMRRACKRIGIRELAPYSFRHVAIATWSRAGLSPQEIARLCGHTSIKTAHAHYARAGAGHKRKAVARAMIDPHLGEELEQRGAVEATEKDPVGGGQPLQHTPVFEIEEMPVARPAPRKGSEPMSPEAVAAAFARFNPAADFDVVGHRNAQHRRGDLERNSAEDDPLSRKDGI